MRRITCWLLATVVALILLFSYRTSTMGVGGAEASAVAASPLATQRAGGSGAGGTDADDADSGTATTGTTDSDDPSVPAA